MKRETLPELKAQAREVWRLSLPAILTQITTIAMQYIDSAMVGALGANASASIGLVSTSTWLIGGIIGGVVGARAYYVLLNWSDYAGDWKSIFNIRGGGLAIYGGIIGSLLVGFLVAKIRKVKFLPLLDIVGIGFLLGQGIGRWGNFINREAFGRETAAFSRMGLTLPGQETVYVHPTFLYESLWNFAGFLMLHFWFRKHERRFDGELILLYAVWYGIGRALIEGLRTDSLYITGTGIRVSQLLAGVSAAAAAVVLALLYTGKLRHPPRYVDRESGEAQQDA